MRRTFPGAGGGCGLLSFFVGFLRGGMRGEDARGGGGEMRYILGYMRGGDGGQSAGRVGAGV